MKSKIFSLLLLLALTGCAYKVQTKITAYLDKTAPAQIPSGASIAVITNDQAANPLLEKEVKQKIDRLLEKRAYKIAAPTDADYFLFFAYGLGTPRQVSVDVPVFGYGVATSRKYSITSFGLGTGTAQRTFHDRWLTLNVIDARKFRDTGKSEAVWVADTASSGASSDLRSVINYMLIGTFEHFGQDTGKQVSFIMEKEDLRAKELE